MSFILDALRRSERARRVLGAAQTPAVAAPPAAAPRGRWLAWLAALLVLNLAALAWFMLRTPDAPLVPAASAPPAGAVRSLANEAGVPAQDAAPPTAVADAPPELVSVEQLPAALRERVATLHIDAHGWSDDPQQRFVVMNLKRHKVGDALESGAKLVEITRDGVVVEIEGRRIPLARQ